MSLHAEVKPTKMNKSMHDEGIDVSVWHRDLRGSCFALFFFPTVNRQQAFVNIQSNLY